ncbi:MAG: tetratricopeptide repeat protein [Bacteroidetes bacterium]|nr:tetratricopeptide repeat protein [Bacteroidota bacterium]
MKSFHAQSYSVAYSVFQNLIISETSDGISKEIASFYSAECLLGLDQIDGAIPAYTQFIENYKNSGMRGLALFKLGVLQFKAGNNKKSIETLVSLIKQYPGSEYSGNAYYWIGEAFSAEGKLSEAKEYLHKSIDADEQKLYIDYKLFALSKIYENNGEYKDAIIYYDRILSEFWDSELAPLAQLRIGICHYKLGDYNSAVLELSDSIIGSLSDEVRNQADYLLADSFFKLEEYQEAKKVYDDILGKDRNRHDDELRYGSGWVSFQMHDYDKAYQVFKSLSESANDTLAASSLYWSAECKRYSGEKDLSMNILEKYLNKYPKHYLVPTAMFNIGIIYYQKENYARAEEYLIPVTQSSNNSIKSKAYNLLGELRLTKKDFEDAHDYFLRAVDLSKNDVNLLNRSKVGLGITYYYLNEYEKSINTLNEVNSKYQSFEKDKVNFYLAESHFIMANYEVALRHYLRVYSEDALINKQTLYGKAYTYYNLKDFSNAAYYFNEYSQAYRSDKYYTDVRLRLADCYYGLKDFDRASNIYDSLFNRERKNVDNDFAYFQYGQALFKSGKYSKAIDEFASLQKRFPRSKYSDDSQYIIGWIYFQQKDYENSIQSYTDLFNKYPKSPIRPITYYSIGDAYFNLGEYDLAVVNYRKILEEYPNTQYVYDAINGIQYCYMTQDTPEKAVDLIDRYISSNSESEFRDQVLFKKGDIYFSIGEYDKSQNAYKEFLRTFPQSKLVPNAHYWIGKCEQIKGSTEGALSNYYYVYNNFLNSEYGVSAVLEIGNIKTELDDLDEVLRIYNHSIEQLPGTSRLPELMYNKGLALIAKGDHKNAYKTLQEITQFFVESVFTEKSKIKLGVLELQNERYDNAEIYFSEVGENRTDDIGAEAQYYYGLTLMKKEEINDAITIFVRVRSVFPGYDEWYTKALIGLGDCYVILGDKKEAREMYRAVLKRHSDDDYSTIVKEKMKQL